LSQTAFAALASRCWGQQAARSNRNSAAPSLSRQFARWAAPLRYEDLPAEVVDRVKGVTLQALSSALQGSGMAASKEAMALVTGEESGVRNGATIMVTGAKATRGGAAYANAEMALAGGKWDTFRMLTQNIGCHGHSTGRDTKWNLRRGSSIVGFASSAILATPTSKRSSGPSSATTHRQISSAHQRTEPAGRVRRRHVVNIAGIPAMCKGRPEGRPFSCPGTAMDLRT
jgi:hypothetical protein